MALLLAHGGLPAAPPGLGSIASTWTFELGPVVGLLAAAALYVLAVRRVRRRGGRWARGRSAAFATGLAVLAASLLSGIGAYAEGALSVHMIQHTLMTLVGVPLVLLGAPLTLALRALPPSPRRRLARALASPAGRALGHPLTGWGAFVAFLLVSHLPSVYGAALEHPAVHDAGHVLYVVTAVLFWRPLLARDAGPVLGAAGRLAALTLAMPPMGVIGAALMSAETVAYAAYLEPARAWGLSALADQRLAAAVMWGGGGAALVAATLLSTWAALVAEHRRTVRRERYEDQVAPVARSAP